MKIDEFLSNRDPGDETKEPVFEHVTSLTPSGIECLYSWAPKRLYRLRCNYNVPDEWAEWVEVPSVTTALGILDKSGALTWWGMKTGVEGVLELRRKRALWASIDAEGEWSLCLNSEGDEYGDEATAENVVSLLTQHKLTVNHVKDKAADRGTNVHGALESWAIDQSYRANPDLYEKHERGYLVGLNKFLDDLEYIADVEAEVMVGSLEHGFAGRYDLRLTTNVAHNLVTKAYPKRADKIEEVPAGKYLLDLKTSKNVYPSHGLQLAAYELASIECGYGPTDYRAVIHVTADGKYEFVRTHASPQDFLSILQAYNTMQGAKTWIA